VPAIPAITLTNRTRSETRVLREIIPWLSRTTGKPWAPWSSLSIVLYNTCTYVYKLKWKKKKEAERELDGAKILQICLKIYLDTEQRNVIAKKSNSIIHWDHFKPSNRDYPITNCLIQSNRYYQLPLTDYLFIRQNNSRHWWCTLLCTPSAIYPGLCKLTFNTL
jgi:hypothetical protein